MVLSKGAVGTPPTHPRILLAPNVRLYSQCPRCLCPSTCLCRFVLLSMRLADTDGGRRGAGQGRAHSPPASKRQTPPRLSNSRVRIAQRPYAPAPPHPHGDYGKIVFNARNRFRVGREAPRGGAFFLFSRAQLPHPNHVGRVGAPTS